MEQPSPAPPPDARRKPAPGRTLEIWLFRARWLMAPFYVGLVLALVALLVVFGKELWHELSGLADMTPAQGVVMALSLIDLSLAGNLLVIVIFSGYETFVSKMDLDEDTERPDWMGLIDFSGLKMKLMASIVAISAVALLRAFVQIAENQAPPQPGLIWLVGIQLTFVVSALLLALMDFVVSKTTKH
jgi:uncharacterized protein (TIGR00645 family)